MASELLIVLLAHNEAACIRSTVEEVRRVIPQADVAVVDDGSADDTAAAASAAGATVLRLPFNLGVAAGESTGLQYAQRRGHRFVVRLDGDGQHDPASVPPMIERLRQGADLVVGSRFLGLESFQSTALRRAGNRLISTMLSSLVGQAITDPTSGMRAFGPRAIALFAQTHPHDYPEPESILMAARRGLRIEEVPAKMRPRRTGQSSLTPFKSGFYMAKVSFALLLERVRG